MEPMAFDDADCQEQVIRLTQEKRDLQDYAERVTRELRRYQQARPPPAGRPEGDLPLPPWATNMQMMTPLLFAYEERINELEAVIERSVSLAEPAQVLTKENDALRVELHERTEQLRNLQLMAPLREVGREGASGDQSDEVQELYRLSVEQNEALAQQNQLLKLQLDKMQQSLAVAQRQAQEVQAQAVEGARTLVAEQERTHHVLTTEKETAERALSAAQERSEVYARQRSAAEHRLSEITGELYEEVRAREQLQSRLEHLEKELQVARQSMDFYKKNLEDRCAMASDDEERLQADLARAVANEREFRERVFVLECEVAELSEQLSAARRYGEAMRREAEQMCRLMESMERRLRDIGEKHESVQRDVAEREAQVDDLLAQKDAWTAAERALKRQVERLESRVQGEMHSLTHHRDHEYDSLQAAHKRAVAEGEEQLRRCEQQVREMQTKAELAERKASWGKAMLERQSSMHKVEIDRLCGDLEEAQQERLRVERQLDGTQQETANLRAELGATAGELRESLASSSSEMAAGRSRIQGLERMLSQVKEEVQTCEARVRSTAGDSSRFKAEVREERTKASEAVEAERAVAGLAGEGAKGRAAGHRVAAHAGGIATAFASRIQRREGDIGGADRAALEG
mmetsp:Transcript_57505/g.161321  ORF Transcript_57505/g.161321 Transcript_57505/m.161321 type:complete len:635 (-) Transcript_57505:112-2016(-)